jgi:hypothetical protein
MWSQLFLIVTASYGLAVGHAQDLGGWSAGGGAVASCAQTISGMPPLLSQNLELSTPEHDISFKSSSHVGLIAMLRRNTRLSPGLVRVKKCCDVVVRF